LALMPGAAMPGDFAVGDTSVGFGPGTSVKETRDFYPLLVKVGNGFIEPVKS
jgi:hypothetical protein